MQNMTAQTLDLDTTALKQQYDREGYCLAPAVFSEEEVEDIKAHFKAIHDGSFPSPYEKLSMKEAGGDILKAYPRVIHPQRFSEKAKAYMLDKRLAHILRVLVQDEPLAAQSMYYFKPPGARGQALHQDQFYLQVVPGTCIAAWTAIDRCDEENGGMMVVPHTDTLPIDCNKEGGSYSENAKSIPIPEGKRAVPAIMNPGDVLFFNGSVIHGSGPNRSKDRWRRSFICHYTTGQCESMGKGYRPIYTMDGKEVMCEETLDRGPCGGPHGFPPH